MCQNSKLNNSKIKEKFIRNTAFVLFATWKFKKIEMKKENTNITV